MKLYKTIKKCRICKSSLKLLHNYRQTPLGEDFIHKKNKKQQPLLNLNLCICRKCKLVQISEIVDPNKIYKDYLYETKTSITLDRHFKDYSFKASKKINLKRKDLVIDIGSNDGNLLSHFKQRTRCNVLGIEPAKHIAKIANKKGINTINSFFNKKVVRDINKRFGKSRLITANNVFANIENINSWIILVKELLTKDGFFVIESFYLADLLKNKVFDFIYHEHHSAFSLKPILYLCDKHNLKLVHAEQTDSKGGSLRYYLCRKDLKYKKSKSLDLLWKREKKEKIYNKLTYTKYFRYISLQKSKLLSFINKNQDNKLYGFGASITCITLIYQFMLENRIKILFDDNKIKQGMLSPRDKIPVQKFSHKNTKKNSILLILAWRYQKSILKKHLKTFKKFRFIIQVMPKFKKIII